MASNLWFSSDHHFDHYNIIEYSSRPFKGVFEMNERLIELHNERVRPQDHWYCLGDFSMKRPRVVQHFLERMNGHKRLIRGNHDIFHTKEYIECGWEEIYGSRVLDNIIFTHIPIHPQSVGRFAANIHGHTHTQPDYPPVMRIAKDQKVSWCPYLNISVERTDYRPISLQELKERIQKESHPNG